MGIEFNGNRILASKFFRKTSLNLNNVSLHYSPKQLIYCKLLSTSEKAGINFGKFKKLL